MNRFSFLFAALIVTSLAVQAPKAGDTPPPETAPKAFASASGSHEVQNDPAGLITAFTAKVAKTTSGENPGFANISILFATVPHPLETYLRASSTTI
jgi:hypothetical protein